MAVRQMLMWYFKKVDLDGMQTNIILDNSGFDTRFRHNYQRDRFNRDMPCHIYIGSSAIAEVHKSPASLTFYMKTWERSPEMQDVYDGVRKAVDEYLLGVKVDTVDKGRREIHDGGDELLLRQNRLEQKRYHEERPSITAVEYERLREMTGLRDDALEGLYQQLEREQRLRSRGINERYQLWNNGTFTTTTTNFEIPINLTDVPF
jgi:hypothetical protein